jgi:DNA-binding NtrC family response regulator
MLRIVLVDQDKEVHHVLRRLLPQSCTLLSYFRGALAGDFVREHRPQAVIIGLDISDVPVNTLISRITGTRGAPPVTVIAHPSQARETVAAMRAGARDCLFRPFGQREVESALARLFAAARSAQAPAATPVAGDAADRLLRGTSPAVRDLREFLRRVAKADIPVLLLGESGSGKELAARAIHELSTRTEDPFVAANCGAIPESLFESEMFGAERGAYTDAVARPGYLERAAQGTMFLDEIGEMSPLNQAKILRVIEERTVRRVGGTREVVLSFRLIAASNRDLPTEVREGRFRRDLFYRLGVLTYRLPPLTDRLEDIPELARGILEQSGLGEVEIDDRVYNLLSAYNWPGNIRELRNVVIRAAILRDRAQIRADDISFV